MKKSRRTIGNVLGAVWCLYHAENDRARHSENAGAEQPTSTLTINSAVTVVHLATPTIILRADEKG